MADSRRNRQSHYGGRASPAGRSRKSSASPATRPWTSCSQASRRRNGRADPMPRTICTPKPGSYVSGAMTTTRSQPHWVSPRARSRPGSMICPGRTGSAMKSAASGQRRESAATGRPNAPPARQGGRRPAPPRPPRSARYPSGNSSLPAPLPTGARALRASRIVSRSASTSSTVTPSSLPSSCGSSRQRELIGLRSATACTSTRTPTLRRPSASGSR